VSLPLRACTIAKATHGDGAAFEIVVKRLEQPSFTFWPCECEPRCTGTEDPEKLAAFEQRLAEHPKAFRKLVAILARDEEQ